MKVILEFNLPHDSEEFKRAKNGTHYKEVISAFTLALRNRRELELDPLTNAELYQLWLSFIAELDL